MRGLDRRTQALHDVDRLRQRHTGGFIGRHRARSLSCFPDGEAM
jgi:hypothetical protein